MTVWCPPRRRPNRPGGLGCWGWAQSTLGLATRDFGLYTLEPMSGITRMDLSDADQASERAAALRAALAARVIIADGAMGTMLQASDATLDDFAGLEGCNEILNVTRPDVVRTVHRGYLEAGADAVAANTFGANRANLAEYDIADRVRELAEVGSRLAREVADEFAEPDRRRFVLGSVGPGTKLPTLGHISFA